MEGYFNMVVENNEPLVIHHSGHTGVVVISLEDYNAIAETEYIMRSPAMVKRIKEAEKEMLEGKGEVIDIDDLWK
jgi:antitoxin YefM